MTFLCSAEDLQWLRDTVPAVRPWSFSCAILEGNDDCPRRIVLAERDHVDSVTVTLDLQDDGSYRSSIGKGMSPEPHRCIARVEYLRTADLAAFNVPGAFRKMRNQHATTYVFADGSRFVVGRAGWHRYDGTDGKPYAIRTSSTVAP